MAKTLFYQNSLHRDFSFNTFTSSELVFPAARELSLVTVRGAALQSQPQASRCSGFSCCEAWAPELGLSSCGAPGSLPGQGCAGASHSSRWKPPRPGLRWSLTLWQVGSLPGQGCAGASHSGRWVGS